LIYFVLAAFQAGILAMEVIFSSRRMAWLILLQVLVLAISLTFTQMMLFPNVLGLDNWFHQMFTGRMLLTGHVPVGQGYSMLPLFHTLNWSIQLTGGFTYKEASMTLVLVQLIMGTTLIYSLSKKVFWDHRIALFSALFLAFAGWSVRVNITPVPTSMCFMFVLMALFFILMKRDLRIFSLLLLLTFTIIFTHTVTAVAMAAVMVVGLISWKIRWTPATVPRKFVSWSFVAFFTVVMFSWWSYASGQITKLARVVQWGFSKDAFIDMEARIQMVVPPLEEMLYLAGFFIFFALGFIGVFHAISKRGNQNAAAIGLIGIVLLAIGFAGQVANLGILQERWFYYSQVLLCVPIGATISFLGVVLVRKSRPRGRWLKIALFSSLVAVSLTLVSIFSPIANIDNPRFSPNSSIRYAFTESEIIGAGFLNNSNDLRLFSDFDFGSNPSSDIFQFYYGSRGSRTWSFDNDILTGNFYANGTVKVIREEIFHSTFRVKEWSYQLDYDLQSILHWSNLSKFYSNDMISGYQ
jgi:hypothetical protein